MFGAILGRLGGILGHATGADRNYIGPFRHHFGRITTSCDQSEVVAMFLGRFNKISIKGEIVRALLDAVKSLKPTNGNLKMRLRSVRSPTADHDPS